MEDGMKTFKLVSLSVLHQNKLIDIPLTDGLIINKEDKDNRWLIESYIPKEHKELFESLFEKNEDIFVQVIISHKGNSPAPFKVKILTINTFENHISVLFEGTLERTRGDYAEMLLTELVKEGLSGDELLEKFKEKMSNKKNSVMMERS